MTTLIDFLSDPLAVIYATQAAIYAVAAVGARHEGRLTSLCYLLLATTHLAAAVLHHSDHQT